MNTFKPGDIVRVEYFNPIQQETYRFLGVVTRHLGTRLEILDETHQIFKPLLEECTVVETFRGLLEKQRQLS